MLCREAWGDGFLKQLSSDLAEEFPEMKGFSYRNLKSIRQLYLYYSQEDMIGKQLVSQLESAFFSVPWGHHILIMQRCKAVNMAMFYIRQIVENNWSRTVLDWQMDSRLYERQCKAVSNFSQPFPFGALARRMGEVRQLNNVTPKMCN